MGHLFTFLTVFFEAQKFLIWSNLIYLHFYFVACAFTVIIKKPLLISSSQWFIPKFSSNSFIVLALTHRSMSHFKLTSVHHARQGSNFILLHMDIQLSYYNLLKREFFPHWIFLAPLSKIHHKCRGLFLDSHSIPLIYISILIPLPHCLDYCSFAVKFSNWEMWVLQFPLLFLKIILATMGPLHFFMNFKISLSISAKQKPTEVLVGTVWNL